MQHRRREPEPQEREHSRTSLELLAQPLVRLWRNLNRRTVRFAGETWKLMFPYSSRSIRRRKWRAAILALCVALSIVVFSLFEAHFTATHARFSGRVQPLPLEADLVATRDDAWSPADVNRLNFMPDVTALDVGTAVEVYSPVGFVGLAALDRGSFAPRDGEGGVKPDAGLAGDISLTNGDLPDRPDQILVPAQLAAAVRLNVGDRFGVEYRDSSGDLHPVVYEICGLHRTKDPHLDQLLTVLPRGSEESPIPAFDGVYGDYRHPGGNLVLMRSGVPDRLRGDLDRALPGADLLTRTRGREMTGTLLRDVFSSGRFLIFLALVFSSLGVLNALLLTFLERQRELGIFKALGTLNDEVRIMLWQEGFLTAMVGIAAGVGMTQVLVWLLNAYTASSYVLAPASLAIAVGAALIVFYAGAILPGLMARNMTVEDLLRRRNIL